MSAGVVCLGLALPLAGGVSNPDNGVAYLATSVSTPRRQRSRNSSRRWPAARGLPSKPAIEELERYAGECSSLVADDPLLRAATGLPLPGFSVIMFAVGDLRDPARELPTAM